MTSKGIRCFSFLTTENGSDGGRWSGVLIGKKKRLKKTRHLQMSPAHQKMVEMIPKERKLLDFRDILRSKSILEFPVWCKNETMHINNFSHLKAIPVALRELSLESINFTTKMLGIKPWSPKHKSVTYCNDNNHWHGSGIVIHITCGLIIHHSGQCGRIILLNLVVWGSVVFIVDPWPKTPKTIPVGNQQALWQLRNLRVFSLSNCWMFLFYVFLSR